VEDGAGGWQAAESQWAGAGKQLETGQFIEAGKSFSAAQQSYTQARQTAQTVQTQRQSAQTAKAEAEKSQAAAKRGRPKRTPARSGSRRWAR